MKRPFPSVEKVFLCRRLGRNCFFQSFCAVVFVECPRRNANFGGQALHFLQTSQAKRSFLCLRKGSQMAKKDPWASGSENLNILVAILIGSPGQKHAYENAEIWLALRDSEQPAFRSTKLRQSRAKRPFPCFIWHERTTVSVETALFLLL